MIYTDQLGREINIPHQPLKIISTVPSQTELLFDLGLKDRIAGITRFCTHPKDGVKKIVQIGGTKQLNIELIKTIKPDLIIANKEENERDQIETLANDFPIWISDIFNLDDSLKMISSIGEIVNEKEKADTVIRTIKNNFESLQPINAPLRTLYFIWRKPYMVAGEDNFINDMLKRCGFINVASAARYPVLTAEKIKEARPDVILLSSEPYPFKEKHMEEFKTLLPHTAVYLVDGEMFSWYGSRLIYAPEYFNKLTDRIRQDLSPKN